MAVTSSLLYGAIALLMVDGLMEMSFIASMVSWLHLRAGGDFIINHPSEGPFPLHGKPEGLLADQGHASNGAGGTALIAIGLGGILALVLRNRQVKRTGSLHGFVSGFYNFWLTMTVLSAIYSLVCLIYTMVLTYGHNHQGINIDVAAGLNNRPYPNYEAYPLLEWTPQNWYTAVLRLPVADQSDYDDIHHHLVLMKAWQWNLVPLTVIGLVVTGLAFADRMAQKQGENQAMGASRLARHKENVPISP